MSQMVQRKSAGQNAWQPANRQCHTNPPFLEASPQSTQIPPEELKTLPHHCFIRVHDCEGPSSLCTAGGTRLCYSTIINIAAIFAL